MAALCAGAGRLAERQRELIDRPEFTEGVRAFLAKRPPVFPPR